MENKIKFKKKIIRFGTSWGVLLEKPILEIIDITSDELEKGLFINITMERADEEKHKQNLLVKLAKEKMVNTNTKEIIIKLKDDEDEKNDQEKQKDSTRRFH